MIVENRIRCSEGYLAPTQAKIADSSHAGKHFGLFFFARWSGLGLIVEIKKGRGRALWQRTTLKMKNRRVSPGNQH